MRRKDLKFNFFVNSLSIHQAPLIKKLSEDFKVSVFYDIDISSERKALGWNIPDFGRASLFELNVDNVCIKLLKESNNINIYSGINAYAKINSYLKLISPKSNSKNIVQMESIYCHGFKGVIRKIKYILLARKYNHLVDLYLCQGSGQQYQQLGFKNAHDFGYFLDSPNRSNYIENKTVKFIYLGAISTRKQIYGVVDALKNSSIHLDIYGSEEDVSIDSLKYLVRENNYISYRGSINNSEVPSLLKNYDYLILPSKIEGWGAVVVEALLSGVGVIVTQNAGVNNYISNRVNHKVYTFDFDDMDSLPSFLASLHPLTPSDREIILHQSYCLSADFGKKLLLEKILE